MGILDSDSSSGDILYHGDPDKLGQNTTPTEGPSGSSGASNREGETPQGENNPPSPARPGRSTFGRYKGIAPKVRVGYPCMNCIHTHLDHSRYEPRLCLFDEECKCSGLKIDNKLIPSRLD